MNVPGLLFFVKDVADMVFDMAFHMAFPFWEEIQEQGCGIEFAYARTATLESYSENRHFAIALLKSRTDDTYWLKYYICKWEKAPRVRRIAFYFPATGKLLLWRKKRIKHIQHMYSEWMVLTAIVVISIKGDRRYIPGG